MMITLRRAACISVAAAALAAAPAAAQTADAADEALKKGDLAEAKAQLEQAVKRNPADCNAALLYASTLPPKEALKIADSLSRAQSAPGWVRALALRFSGDHFFLKEDYKKAADAYLQASQLDSASMYKHLYALSIAMDGHTGTARTVWNGIALDKKDELGGEAARLSALMPKPIPIAADTETVKLPIVAQFVQPNNTAKTDSVKTQSKPVAPTAPANPPVAPVNQQTNIVKTDSVKTQPKPAATVTPTAPANPPVASVNQPNNTVTVDSVKTQSAKTATVNPPANPKPTGPVFTIQVGAFASKENADNLIKRLAGKYEDITVSTTGSGDQTLYRVRVGTFYKKEDATAFADKLIIEAGLSARVTEK